MTRRTISICAAILACSGAALALQEAKPAPASRPVTLHLGDPAPALDVEKWVKGKPLERIELGHVYVVEFWATWCQPCVAGMPHLSALQREYGDKGLTVIGLTCTDNRDNTLEAVEQLIAKKGPLVDYSIAWDHARITHDAWLLAAGISTIPHALVVDKQGKIAAIDNPVFLDDAIAQIVAGTWDIERGNAELAKAHEVAAAAFAKVMESDKAALAGLAEFEASFPKLAHAVDPTRCDIALRAGDFDTAYSIVARWMETAIAHRNYEDLALIARKISNPRAGYAVRRLDLALQAATKADELTGGKNASVLDALARVHAEQGDLKQAIELQTRALELVTDYTRGEMQKSLDEYRAKLGK
jgi:thiol-disulfide isomerase/thioredoxin